MINADAAVKPTRTECERKLVTKPRRPNRSTRCTNPTSRASTAAAGEIVSEPCTYNFPSVVAVISDTIATGPTASWRDVPKTAYAITGAIDAYSPIWGGSPARSA